MGIKVSRDGPRTLVAWWLSDVLCRLSRASGDARVCGELSLKQVIVMMTCSVITVHVGAGMICGLLRERLRTLLTGSGGQAIREFDCQSRCLLGARLVR
jgi:hypothetical protein